MSEYEGRCQSTVSNGGWYTAGCERKASTTRVAKVNSYGEENGTKYTACLCTQHAKILDKGRGISVFKDPLQRGRRDPIIGLYGIKTDEVKRKEEIENASYACRSAYRSIGYTRDRYKMTFEKAARALVNNESTDMDLATEVRNGLAEIDEATSEYNRLSGIHTAMVKENE